MLTTNQITIYSAGKTWAAPMLKIMRDTFGYNIVARWIDAEQVLATPDSVHPESVHSDENFKRFIWNSCREDCLIADMGILLCNPVDGEKHSGSLVETGHITAFGKPVYILGTCASVEPVGHSDRAWKSQENIYRWPEYVGDASIIAEGFERATNHYIKNYSDQWKYRRVSGSLRENYDAMFVNNPLYNRNV